MSTCEVENFRFSMITLYLGDNLPLYVRAHLQKLKKMNISDTERQLLTRRIIEQTLRNRLVKNGSSKIEINLG